MLDSSHSTTPAPLTQTTHTADHRNTLPRTNITPIPTAFQADFPDPKTHADQQPTTNTPHEPTTACLLDQLLLLVHFACLSKLALLPLQLLLPPVSLQSKALCVHDSQLDAVQHLLLAGVLRQQQRVEAGVAGGQLVAVWAVPLDHTLECTQATDGRPAG